MNIFLCPHKQKRVLISCVRVIVAFDEGVNKSETLADVIDKASLASIALEIIDSRLL